MRREGNVVKVGRIGTLIKKMGCDNSEMGEKSALELNMVLEIMHTFFGQYVAKGPIIIIHIFFFF